MKRFRVTFEVHVGRDHKDVKSVIVEAGNKTAAYKRGLTEMSKMKEYSEFYKNIINVEEI